MRREIAIVECVGVRLQPTVVDDFGKPKDYCYEYEFRDAGSGFVATVPTLKVCTWKAGSYELKQECMLVLEDKAT